MSCWHYHHCGSVTGPSSWCRCLRLACSSSLTRASPHFDKVAVGEKLNQTASRPVQNRSQRIEQNLPSTLVSFWQPVPHSSKASFLSATCKHRNWDVTLQQEVMTWHFSPCLDCIGITPHYWAQLSVTLDPLKGRAECQHRPKCVGVSVRVYQHILTPYRTPQSGFSPPESAREGFQRRRLEVEVVVVKDPKWLMWRPILIESELSSGSILIGLSLRNENVSLLRDR